MYKIFRGDDWRDVPSHFLLYSRCSVSGMSPFLGDEDNQTLSNVLAASWYFDEDAFEHVSAEARDFISNLLIREKG